VSSATDSLALPVPGVATPVAAIARPRLAVVLLTCAGAFLVLVDVSVANALLPAIGATFRTTDRATLAWIITAYAIVFAAALVPAGRLADRLGRRQVYVAGLSAFAVGSALCGLAPNLPLLVAGRVAQGVAAAAVSPASMGLLLAAADTRGSVELCRPLDRRRRARDVPRADPRRTAYGPRGVALGVSGQPAPDRGHLRREARAA
jgi:hypothetical protein